MSPDDILFAPISDGLVGSFVVDSLGRKMKVVKVGSIDPDYLTCEWYDHDGTLCRENFWRISVSVVE